MELLKGCSRRTLFWIIFYMGLMCILIDVGFLLLLRIVTPMIAEATHGYASVARVKSLITDAGAVVDLLRVYFVPVSAGVFALFGLLLWLCLRLSFGRMIKKGAVALPTESKTPVTPKKSSEAERREREIQDRRLFLHLLSVLQREGRLMDFLAEDLDEYDDDQVGAAVRNIHENCNKALEKYITADAVMAESEEEEVTVPPEFDPSAVKLTGNVTGDPPFTGIVRHRGWRAGKIDLPTLSATRDPNIIAPAEVEIV